MFVRVCVPVNGIAQAHHAQALLDLLLFLADDLMATPKKKLVRGTSSIRSVVATSAHQRQQVEDELGQRQHHVEGHDEAQHLQRGRIDVGRLREELLRQQFQVRRNGVGAQRPADERHLHQRLDAAGHTQQQQDEDPIFVSRSKRRREERNART